ncbi:hypothetical protein [Syntrophomonas erecta]
MYHIPILFFLLLVSALLLQFSGWGLIITGNPTYLFAVFMSTAAMVWTSYQLFVLLYNRKLTNSNQYHIVIIDNHTVRKDPLLNRITPHT